MSEKIPKARKWQLRLSPEEDGIALRLAAKHMESKNDVVRRAIRLLARFESETSAGNALYIERRGKRRRIEVWLP